MQQLFCRKQQHVSFIATVFIFFCIFSLLQYQMTYMLLMHWPPDKSSGLSRLATPEAIDEKVDAIEDDHPNQRSQLIDDQHRPLGVVMPTIDYATFKQLERRNAKSNDPDVIRVARNAMMEPPTVRRKAKIRFIKETRQSQAVNQVLRNKTNGFFIECGAFDGETASNTLFLEHRRKWTGLLIEMDPYFYTQLVGKRRNAWSINACLSNNNRVVEMQFKESDGQLGRLNVDKNQPSAAGNVRQANRKNIAFCFPLESLLFALNRTHVDYFSLDVEGFELDILRKIPFDQLDIDVLTAEFLHASEPKSSYDELMEGYGYRRYKQIGNMDLMFVKESLLLKEKNYIGQLQIGREKQEKQRRNQDEDAELRVQLDHKQNVGLRVAEVNDDNWPNDLVGNTQHHDEVEKVDRNQKQNGVNQFIIYDDDANK